MHKLIPIFFLTILLSVHGQDTNNKGLSDDYKDHFMIGTIYHGAILGNDNQNLNQKKEFEITNREFNAITAENCMKPMYLIDDNGAYDFEESDAFVTYAQSNGLTIIGHTLVWKNSAPDWFFKGDDGKVVSRDVLIQRLEAYIEKVVTRYKGKIAYWDVVNEAVDVFKTKDGKKYAKLKSTPWHDIIGDDYIKIAYEAAHRADPDCKLLYNDYNMYQKEKIDFIINMVKNLRSQGVPIHGIGSQGHMFMQHPLLEEVEYWLKECSKANIPLHITEMDISVLPNAWKHKGASVEDRFDLAEEFNPYSRGVPERVLKLQARRYKALFKLFLKYSANVERVTFWGVWDGNSWRNYLPMQGRTDYPLLFDRNFKKKPAYHALKELVNKDD
jgi:endo-1,4-beta-xylanase